ncbi:MAG: M28 family peptidase, partial [Flavobacteriales bacterium]|nr:M28 family peptidase [Flavobacteriales bacterium]
DISADSLHGHLTKLQTFQTRHVYSDTVSLTTGIGAARRWVYSRFQQFAADNENRLIASYMQFDWLAGACGDGEFRNIVAVLPGWDTTDKSVIIFEGHIDSRCAAACDITCFAPGIEDNGSGTALVIELARTLSRYSFKHTLVFVVTVGEELGLYGAKAFSKYVEDNNIEIKAVQNNDVIGGITCGATSSPPSCPFLGHIDSTHVRIFSKPGTTSGGYARFTQLVYQEKLLPHVNVPMTVRVMNQEDRTGRGGDHQPFTAKGYTAIRFTAQNEHGDGTGTPPDRTHTADDVVGIDTDADGIIDSFYVDFNYLKRNAVINAVVAKIADLGPEIPSFSITNNTSGIMIQITGQTQYSAYRVHAREASNSFSIDSLKIYRFSDTLAFMIPGIESGKAYYISVASVDSFGMTSPFSTESSLAIASVSTATAPADPLPYFFTCPNGINEFQNSMEQTISLRCIPNPTSGRTRITVGLKKVIHSGVAEIVIQDVSGKIIFRKGIELNTLVNELSFDGTQYATGIYIYSLVLDGAVLRSEKLSLVE